MKLKLLFLGRCADIIGKEKQVLETSRKITISQLCKEFKLNYPELGKISFAIAINNKINKSNRILSDNDEIAFIPPVSGG